MQATERATEAGPAVEGTLGPGGFWRVRFRCSRCRRVETISVTKDAVRLLGRPGADGVYDPGRTDECLNLCGSCVAVIWAGGELEKTPC